MREMKRFCAFFICFFIAGISMPASSAITIKKAAPVATQESSSSETTTSLVSTVLGLVNSVQQMNAKQKELTAECIPTSQEINFVDETMKEWAKTGSMSAKEVQSRLGRKPCNTSTGYETAVTIAAGTDSDDICYNWFTGSAEDGTIWAGYPKVGKATYCSDGSRTCSDKNKKTVSDIYDIFNLIDFTEADYTATEATMAAKILSKVESCSYAKLNARKRALWGELLTNTVNNIGQPTNTGTIMQQVGAIAGSGSSGLGGLSSLGSIATQFLAN